MQLHLLPEQPLPPLPGHLAGQDEQRDHPGAIKLSCHDSQNIAASTRTRFSGTDSDPDIGTPTARCVSLMSSSIRETGARSRSG